MTVHPPAAAGGCVSDIYHMCCLHPSCIIFVQLIAVLITLACMHLKPSYPTRLHPGVWQRGLSRPVAAGAEKRKRSECGRGACQCQAAQALVLWGMQRVFSAPFDVTALAHPAFHIARHCRCWKHPPDNMLCSSEVDGTAHEPHGQLEDEGIRTWIMIPMTVLCRRVHDRWPPGGRQPIIVPVAKPFSLTDTCNKQGHSCQCHSCQQAPATQPAGADLHHAHFIPWPALVHPCMMYMHATKAW